ncbi:MAG: ferredoxin/flavodoxin---NADP+ reductase [Actinomycetota bacterium]|nr:ferredoxin/flavodoxin---NADP+ reductase [Actinomycetota bacterium]
MQPRVAVVGSGPAGVYAAEALIRYAGEVSVDVLDALPAPFGLVRYAVAPDHPRTQSISESLATVLDHPGVRFLGNVRVGADISIDELLEHYDAVVIAVGAATDRRMGIPGEDLPGSVSATDLVAWYCGNPDVDPGRFVLDASSVAVVGAGNVAGDIARMLARSAGELAATDAPDHILAAFAASSVRDIHLIARRGPAQSRFTTRELRELGDLELADLLVDPADLELDAHSAEVVSSSSAARRNVEVLRGWVGQAETRLDRRIHLRFFQRPVEVLGTDRVEAIRLERTRLDVDGEVHGTGDIVDLPVQMVVRAVGYRSLPLDGLPFDEGSGVVPHLNGRVHRDGVVMPGLYVAGWAKRGPTGVIGTNKHDARETVRSLMDDLPALPRAAADSPDAVVQLLESRGVDVVSWAGWRAIDLAEVEAGRRQGRPRAKISDRAALLRIAAGEG